MGTLGPENSEKQVTFSADSKLEPDEKTTTSSTLGGDKEYIPNDLDTCKKLILKILSPYFSAGRFKDKILFKEMAKLLTKALVEVNSKEIENTRPRAKLAVKRAVKNFFLVANSVTDRSDFKKLKLKDVQSLRQPTSSAN